MGGHGVDGTQQLPEAELQYLHGHATSGSYEQGWHPDAPRKSMPYAVGVAVVGGGEGGGGGCGGDGGGGGRGGGSGGGDGGGGGEGGGATHASGVDSCRM